MEEGKWPFSESAPSNHSVPSRVPDLCRLSSVELEAVKFLKSFVYQEVTGMYAASIPPVLPGPVSETLTLAWTSEALTRDEPWVWGTSLCLAPVWWAERF